MGQKASEKMTQKQRDGQDGTALAEGRSSTVTYPERTPEMIKAVEEYNTSLAAAYKTLEASVLSSPMPVARVMLIHVSEIQANDYNPNAVAGQEMKLLHTSISEDGYTQPVVAIVDHKCDILLPCGHFSTLEDPTTASFLMKALSVTPLGSSTVRVASRHLEAKPLTDPVGVFRSASRKETTVEISVSGSEISGGSGTSMSSEDSASPMSGTSTVLETSSGSLLLVCPTCASSDPELTKSWLHSELVSDEESGLMVSWLSSESIEEPLQKSSQMSSAEVLLRSEASAETSETLLWLTSKSKAIIVDGFHRYTTMRRFQDIVDSTQGYLPVVVLEKSIADRIASTVRHNRARGKHSVAGMGSLVFQMLEQGEDDVTICNKLGLEAEELARLKHITGFSKLFKDTEYSPLVFTQTQAREKAKYAREHPEETPLPEGV